MSQKHPDDDVVNANSSELEEHTQTLNVHRAARGQRPTHIGDYRVLGLLGEGGMGVVYEAEQQNPRRRVAVKVMRQGHLVDELHARMFQREAETLGRLKHANIAAIYESGHTSEGHDFFAMELVRGVTLDRWLEQRPSPVDEDELELRLRIFGAICSAVHYAHQRGVIHRDLKPSNIIVGEGERSTATSGSAPPLPSLKILDFGLARITDQDVAATMASEIGTIKGTLPYMSPEQARGNPDAIDVRTDVYALGVILYEMLAGSRPYEVVRSALAEAVRVICEEAPRPLGQSWQGAHRLDPDVVTIVGKALEKEPERRYGSAAAMAEDIERYLSSQPISARPPSALYQMRKFARRNRVLVGSLATGLAALVAFAFTMAVQAERIAVERDRANREAQRARQVSSFLIDLFEASDPTRAQGEDITAREMLDGAAAKIEALAAEPLAQAAFMETIGRVSVNLGLFPQAEDMLTRALAIREAHAEEDELALAACLHAVADLYNFKGENEKAEGPALRAVAIRERLLGEHPDLASSLNTLGNVLWHLDRLQEAERIHRRGLAIREATLPPQHPDIASSLHNIGALRYFATDYAAAEELYTRSISIEEAAHGPDNWNLATSLHTLAIVYQDQARYDDALALEERALAIREKVLGPEHPHVALSLTTLGNILNGLERPIEAVPHLRRAVRVADAAWGPTHPELWWMRRSLARALMAAGSFDEAETKLRDLIATIEAGQDESRLPLNLDTLGELLRRRDRLAEAEVVYRRSVAIGKDADPDDPYLGLSYAGLARVLAEQRRDLEAASAYRHGLRLMTAGWGTEDRDVLRVLDELRALEGGRARGGGADLALQHSDPGSTPPTGGS